MKKLIIIMFLTFLPSVSISAENQAVDNIKSIEKAFDNGTLAKFGKDVSNKSNEIISNSGRSLEQAFEDFKKDPIGQMKYYFNEGVRIGQNFIQWAKDLMASLKK